VSLVYGVRCGHTYDHPDAYHLFVCCQQYAGIMGIAKALSALERSQPASRTQLTLQRLQGLSMLVYYPLEYVSFFSSPFAPLLSDVSPAMSAKAQLWSIRAWGVYVGLQILLLRHEWKSIARKEYGTDVKGQDKAALKKRKFAIVCGLVANISRLPVILHWYCSFFTSSKNF
jgi:hypothetical protein